MNQHRSDDHHDSYIQSYSILLVLTVIVRFGWRLQDVTICHHWGRPWQRLHKLWKWARTRTSRWRRNGVGDEDVQQRNIAAIEHGPFIDWFTKMVISHGYVSVPEDKVKQKWYPMIWKIQLCEMKWGSKFLTTKMARTRLGQVQGCGHPVVGSIVNGSFIRNGENHGKPTYKKTEQVRGETFRPLRSFCVDLWWFMLI